MWDHGDSPMELVQLVPGIFGMLCSRLVKSLWECWVPHLSVTAALEWVFRAPGSGYCLPWLWL